MQGPERLDDGRYQQGYPGDALGMVQEIALLWSHVTMRRTRGHLRLEKVIMRGHTTNRFQMPQNLNSKPNESS